MPIITIRGQLGSGAPEVGADVARIIKGDYVGREILETIAQLVGRPASEIETKERFPARLVPRIMSALGEALARLGTIESAYGRSWQEPLENEKYLDALVAVIQALALEPNVVIMGRGSQFILDNHPSALHVLVIAPLQVRIKRVMTILKIGEDEARKQIEGFDNSRKAFIRRFFKRIMEKAEHYDLLINTEHPSYETAARIIATAAEEKIPWSHG